MYYNHANLSTDCYSIAKQIENSNWRPDFIVGIVRGGLIPAVIISHKLGIPLEVLQWSTRDFKNQDISFGLKLKHDYGHKELLLVDDIVDNGETIYNILKHLPNAKTATLIYNTQQKLVIPNYYGRTIDRAVDKEWVNFWWEKCDGEVYFNKNV
jgi:hypoxanthine phosphoribosyltransferase